MDLEENQTTASTEWTRVRVGMKQHGKAIQKKV